jgi:UDP-N-acetylmuramyl pentapeptide synthase
MIYSVLAAAAVAAGEKVSLDEILERLKRVGPAPGRMQSVRLMNGAVLLRDESKSTMETVEAALKSWGRSGPAGASSSSAKSPTPGLAS